MNIKKIEEDTCVDRLKSLHEELAVLRNRIAEEVRETGLWEGRYQNIEGLLNCGLGSLYDANKEAEELEVSRMDAEFGPGVGVICRGIGRDRGADCFVCGASTTTPDEPDGGYLHNISAFVSSKITGDAAVEMFRTGGAWLDYRPSYPHRVQLKIYACDKHLPRLKYLERLIRRRANLREAMIPAAISWSPTEPEGKHMTVVVTNRFSKSWPHPLLYDVLVAPEDNAASILAKVEVQRERDTGDRPDQMDLQLEYAYNPEVELLRDWRGWNDD